MKEITIRLYSYDELSDEARHRAYRRYLETYKYCSSNDIRNTIHKLEEELGIEVSRWSYGSCSYDAGTIRFKHYNDDQLALSGVRAQAFLWNNFAHLVMQPRRKWYAKNVTDGRVDYSGTIYCSGDWRNRWRESKVFFDRTYDGTCPLAGACFDNDALDPLCNFCFGVKWDEKAKRRVMIPQSMRMRWSATTVEDVLRGCVDALLVAAREDCRYHESEEYFAERCREDDAVFEKNGTRREIDDD